MSVVVSVVIPCYNQGSLAAEAVSRLVEMPGIPPIYEVVIVDDGSTDARTSSTLRGLAREDVRVISQTNQGLAAARNAGIRNSQGRYILPLDADNRLREGYLIEGVRLLENDPDLSVVYGDAVYFGEQGGIWHVPEYSVQAALYDNTLDACAIFRREIWERVGGYDEHMPFMGYEDWDFWIRVSKAGGRFHKLPRPCFEYRVSRQSLIRKSNEQEMMATRNYILSKHPDLMLDDFLVYRTLLRFFRRSKLYGAYRTIGHFLKRSLEDSANRQTER